MSQPSPVPGWYPDPQQPGIQRYWDGQQWTPYTQGASSRGAVTAASWVKAGVLVASALVLMLVILVLTLGGGNEDRISQADGTEQSTELSNPTTTPSPEPAKAPAKPERARVPGVRALSLAQARGQLHHARL